MAGTEPIAHALEAESIDAVTNPTARTFRAFADKTGGDLKALAACIRASREPLHARDGGRIAGPVLVVAGSEDVIAGPAEDLANLIPGAAGPHRPAPRPHAHRRRPGVHGRRAAGSAAAGVDGVRPCGLPHDAAVAADFTLPGSAAWLCTDAIPDMLSVQKQTRPRRLVGYDLGSDPQGLTRMGTTLIQSA